MTSGIQSNHNSTHHIMDNLHCSNGPEQNNTSTNQVSLPSSIKLNKTYPDSYLIGIDNHASATMTNSEDDFIITPPPVDLKIKGIKGYLKTTKIGTVR
jgi:hypothetical protein